MRSLTAMLLVSGIAVGSTMMAKPANAQCNSWACDGSDIRWSNAGSFRRVRVNTDDNGDGASANAGYQWQIGGTAEWSLATVNVAGGPNVYVLDLYNDRLGALALRASANGTVSTNKLIPLSDNTYQLGDTGARWTAVYAVNGSIQTSDSRQKKNIADLKYGLKEVLKLRPVTFNWKTGPDSRTHVGLIAQEVEKIIPEAVIHGETPSAPLGMNYGDFVPVLIKAVQTQEKVIQSQADRIAKLERASGVASNLGSGSSLAAGLGVLALPAIGFVAFSRRRARSKG